MITLQQYFGKWWEHADATQERVANAERLLAACEELEALAVKDGVEFRDNPVTKSNVSGQTYGGFRPQSCTQGAPKSAHKEGLAVDRFDPAGEIDAWCMKNQDRLKSCGIYIEHPDKTLGWSHWSIKPPGSGKTVFYP
jgi:hypothetical protein